MPEPTSPPLLRIAVEVPAQAAEVFSEALAGGEDTASVAAFEIEPGRWRIEALAAQSPDAADLAARLALAAAAAGVPEPTPSVEPLPAIDWLARNRESFRPVTVGPFQVRRPEHMPKPGALPLIIEAATAFGTGEHATTRGCLLALADVARRRAVRRVLDVGTGSGVLAIAAARLGARRIVATDIDPEAVRVARFHARLNGVASRMRLDVADGVRRAPRAPYDLILANILARPLHAMARDLAALLAPGGTIVLSGLLREQERQVAARYRSAGLPIARRYLMEGWSTLALRRRPARIGRPSEGT